MVTSQSICLRVGPYPANAGWSSQMVVRRLRRRSANPHVHHVQGSVARAGGDCCQRRVSAYARAGNQRALRGLTSGVDGAQAYPGCTALGSRPCTDEEFTV